MLAMSMVFRMASDCAVILKCNEARHAHTMSDHGNSVAMQVGACWSSVGVEVELVDSGGPRWCLTLQICRSVNSVFQASTTAVAAPTRLCMLQRPLIMLRLLELHSTSCTAATVDSRLMYGSPCRCKLGVLKRSTTSAPVFE